jgi:hypothetical protein
MPTTTFRSDVATNVAALLATYATAHPTMLRATARRRPSSFATGEFPIAYLASRDERIDHTAGTRGREMTVAVEIVDMLVDSVESADRMDDLVDGLLDMFTTNYHGAATGTILEPIGVEDGELVVGDAVYAMGRITLRVRIREGRS